MNIKPEVSQVLKEYRFWKITGEEALHLILAYENDEYVIRDDDHVIAHSKNFLMMDGVFDTATNKH